MKIKIKDGRSIEVPDSDTKRSLEVVGGIKTFNGVYDKKEKRTPKPKKPIYTPEELINDPSLRWFPYHRWEALWCEEKRANFRFVCYEDGMVRVATMDGIHELPDLVKKLDLRRITSR